MIGHICEVCFTDSADHPEETDAGRHFPPLCCPGCPCGSYEEATSTKAGTE